ncbi:MAG: alpha/beta hydrolase, partial [Pseudomonadota bacterium]
MKILLILSLLIAVAGLSACITSAVYTSRVEAAYPASGQLIDLDGTRVHVLVDGASGPPVLMIHGASANAREFTQTLAPRLSDRHRVFMVDRPGHGHTARPVAGHTLAVQADLAAKALEALAPGERAVVVGHSFGGAVALRLALDHPENVKGLVLLAPVSHDWGGGGQAWYNRYAAMPVVGS